jgi:hypothetical protein
VTYSVVSITLYIYVRMKAGVEDKICYVAHHLSPELSIVEFKDLMFRRLRRDPQRVGADGLGILPQVLVVALDSRQTRQQVQ